MNENNYQITLNGQKIVSAIENVDRLCRCGHNYLAHIHYNGGLPNKPEGIPTYCGYPTDTGAGCPCDDFKERNYPTTESNKDEVERLGERIVNMFATIEIQFHYTLPSDFCDEFLTAVKNLADRAQAYRDRLKKYQQESGHV